MVKMREEVKSSATVEALAFARSSSPPPTPAASSAVASSQVVPINTGSTDWLGSAQGSKGGSLSSAAVQGPSISLSNNAGNSSLVSSEILCRPWERGDLQRRLATFAPSNWFAKPKGANSLACARRGWINIANDKIECELCGSCLTYSTTASQTTDEVDNAAEAFAKKLDSGHKVSCPWKGNCCADSLVQFPPTPASALIGSYRDRCDGLVQSPVLPVIASSTIEFMRLSRSAQIDRFLSPSLFSSREMGLKADNILMSEISREDPFCHLSQEQKLISLCGWEPRWLPNVQDYEEHSAQSARNACSFGPNEDGYHYKRFPELSQHTLSVSAVKKRGKGKLVQESRCNMRSPLLDCSLCGATIRVWDFLTISRPALVHLGPHNVENVDNYKKLVPTHGTSAASGINGRIGAEGVEKGIEDRDEAATTDVRKSPSNVRVNLNFKIAEEFPVTVPTEADPSDEGGMERDTIGHPAGSEVGDRAASFESRGPSTRKRSLEEGGSAVDRPQGRIQQVDSIEGTVVNRDDDEIDEGTHISDGLSKRSRGLEASSSQHLPHKLSMSNAGPRNVYLGKTINRVNSFKEGSDLVFVHPSANNSAHASSVVAMDTICQNEDENSMESVENYPRDVDEINFSCVASEFNYNNLAQQSNSLTLAAGSDVREMGGSSTIGGEEILNAETFTANARDKFSLGISGGSVDMGASHEAEIHGNDASVHRTYSAVGDAGLIAEVIENVGQSGESAPGPGLMDEFVPDEVLREDPHGNIPDMISRSVGNADSGSKVDGSIKADSIESGEKMNHTLGHGSSAHPSLSCNAMVYSVNDISRGEVIQTGKDTANDDCALDSDNVHCNISGPQIEENNYKQEVGEFDPIKHHNIYCPWVNGNVAAAGLNNDIGTTSSGTVALSGWQLTLDALDAFQTLGHIPNQIMRSESAASLYKNDHLAPSQKDLTRQSASRSKGKHFN